MEEISKKEKMKKKGRMKDCQLYRNWELKEDI
jgi:hypothetical protein